MDRAKLLVDVAHVPRDHARVRTVPANRRFDCLVARGPRAVHVRRAVDDVQAVLVGQIQETCVAGRARNHNRVHAVALTPHDVVEHLRQVDSQARAPIALVAVHSPQDQCLTAQRHTLRSRLNVAEANVKGHGILDPFLIAQRDDQSVQGRLLRAPREHIQTLRVNNLIRRSDRRPQPLLFGLVDERGMNLDAPRRLNPQRQRTCAAIVGRHRHHVDDVCRRPRLQRHFTEQAMTAHRGLHQQDNQRVRVGGLQRARHVKSRRNETVRTKTDERSIEPRVERARKTAESQRHHPAAINRLLEGCIKGKLAAQNRGAHNVGG